MIGKKVKPKEQIWMLIQYSFYFVEFFHCSNKVLLRQISASLTTPNSKCEQLNMLAIDGNKPIDTKIQYFTTL